MRNKRETLGYGLGGNQHIHAANGPALSFQPCPDFAIGKRGISIK